jgi:cytochrome c oxidase cbb3-type subunit I/II
MSHEVIRYGKASDAAEFVYDHPFQWGSKRTGPDLARVGGKYPDMWHYRHFYEPREVTAGSIMPRYKWLFENKIDYLSLQKKMQVMQALGVPYTIEEINNGVVLAKAQATTLSNGLVQEGVPAQIVDKEIVAMIAYIQRIGVDFSKVGTP